MKLLKTYFSNLRAGAWMMLAFAFFFAAYLFNPGNAVVGITFITAFVLVVVFAIGSMVYSGISVAEWLRRSARSPRVSAGAIIVLACIILAGLIPDDWRAATSGVCLVLAIVTLFAGTVAEGKE